MHEIAVLGGGIGGLTLAVALQRRGARVAVYEAAHELHPVGAGIVMPPNAMQIFSRLGLAEQVARAGMAIGFADILDAGDGLLQRSNLGTLAERFGFPAIAIHRGRLQQILVAALSPANLHLGKSFVELAQEMDGVSVRFGDGAEVRAWAVVGADGARSTVRRQLFPDSALRYSGQSSYRGVASVTLRPALDGVSQEIWGRGCRFGFVAIAPGEVYWFATLDSPPGVLREQRPMKPRLAELYAAFPAPVGQLISTTPEASIINTDIHDLRPLPQWHDRRVGLMGDAAHATTPNLGQGGAQAVEDAEMLATCLVAAPDPEAAFAVYEARRRSKTAFVVNRSWQFGKLAHVSNPVLRAIRNLTMRSVPSSLTSHQLERLFRVDESDSIAAWSEATAKSTSMNHR